MANALGRIRNGIAKFVQTGEQPLPTYRSGMSLNVHEVRSYYNPSRMEMSELVPSFSQPVWGPEISSVGAYSREGYTSRTFDKPLVNFKTQAIALSTDEDVQLAINGLSSQITGGAHYWKGKEDFMINYLEQFSKDLNFDTFDTMLVKELLWYGNSFWKPRMGIRNIRRFDDLMQIPIGSAVRIWWDRQRIPYKYEFRGAEYQGYHNPEDIIHFTWNPVNASAFGTGFAISMLSAREFEWLVPGGSETRKLPSMLDRKLSTYFTMMLTEKRYVNHIIYNAIDADEPQRAALTAQLAHLDVGEDIVTGTEVKPIEIGQQARAFNPTQFTEVTQSPIFKALNDFRGKQGQESSHQFANAETSKVLSEIGLAAFPLHVTRQLIDKLFKPWYESNPIYDPYYGGGYVPMPWDICEFELNFGQVEKQDIPIEHQIKLIESAIDRGAVNDLIEMRKLYDDAGLGLTKEMTDQIEQQYNPDNVMPQDFGMPQPTFDIGGNIPMTPQFDNQVMGTPPNSNPIYDDMSQNIRSGLIPEKFEPQPSNTSQDFNIGRMYEKMMKELEALTK